MNLRQQLALSFGRLTARLPASFDQEIWRLLRLARPHRLVRLMGPTHAGVSGSMIASGREPLEQFLPRQFFAEEPECSFIENTPVLRLTERLRQLRGTADVTAVRLDRLLARRLFDQTYLRVPEWIRSSMAVPTLEEQIANGGNSLRQDLRLIRKFHWSFEESHLPEDLARFYEKMYRPHSLGRHGPMAQMRTFGSIQDAFQQGALLWITCEGRKVAGVVVERQSQRMSVAALGADGGDQALVKKGVLAAAYYYAIDYARRNGLPRVDFGGTRPSLYDSLLRYKRKWGAMIDTRPINALETLTYWPVINPSVEAMLKTTPLVFREGLHLCALHIEPTEPLPADITQGLRKIYRVKAGDVFGRMEEQSVNFPPQAVPFALQQETADVGG